VEDTPQEVGDEGKEVAKDEVKEETNEQTPLEEAEKRVKYC